MKILLVIDHFGSGGAQRQIVELARGLNRHGHDVEMFVYFPEQTFFRPLIDEQKIVVHEYNKVSRFSLGLVFRLASLMRKGSFDIVVSYLKSTNVYAELAKLFVGGGALVVSERTSRHDDKSRIAAFARRILHIVADQVVANSVTHCAWLRRKRWLSQKVTCIYNGLNLNFFRPAQLREHAPRTMQELRLLAIGRIGPEKNVLNLIRALELLHTESGYIPEVSWAGRRDESRAGRAYCRRVDCYLSNLPDIQSRWHWLGVQPDVAALLQQHQALIHPSSYEGLPNVVCEGLASGLPVLVSNVCDHSLLVAEGERGFLFDPHDPESIARAIGALVDLDAEQWCKFSNSARGYAEQTLGVEKMILEYENLFTNLLGGPSGDNAQREQL